jgi:hypothetical protein
MNQDYKDKQIVFVVVGSRGGNLEGLINEISTRENHEDLFSGLPPNNRFTISPASPYDNTLIFASKLRTAFPTIVQIETTCLFYILLKKFKPRQIDDFVAQVISRTTESPVTKLTFEMVVPEKVDREEFISNYATQVTGFSGSTLSIEA